MEKSRVHVIPHSHWDREWYFNCARSNVYLVKHVKEVLEHLEKNSEFTYLMDAQSSLAEEYLSFCPEDRERIKKLVKEERLFFGPWYTQTDQLVISQESIVRNLLYGSKYADDLGGYFNVAYAPDIFGQAGNMPQIYKQFKMNRFLFWRGISNNRLPKTEFIWQGSDGTKMIAKQIREGYSNCGHLPEEKDDILPYLNKKMGDLEKEATTKNLYFSNGFDQAPLRKNLLDVLKKYNEIDKNRDYFISSPIKYFEALEKDCKNIKLPIIEGELTEAKHSRIHKSIFSSRADLKQLNNKNENLLVNVLEPILCISNSLGNRYPKKELEKIWKLLFDNAAHDSIGNCNSDSTNRDIFYRHKNAKDYMESLLDLNMRLIASKIKTEKEYQFTAFNPYPEKRNEIVELIAYISDEEFVIKNYQGNKLEYVIVSQVEQTNYVLKQQMKLNTSKKTYTPNKVFLTKMLVEIKDIPALGYKAFYLDLGEKETQKKYSITEDRKIENKYYTITFEENNTLTIYDKINKKEYKNQMIFEENGDDGDSYNYSPPRKDLIITSLEAQVIAKEKYTSSISEKLKIRLKNILPYNLEERANNIRSKEYFYDIEIELRKEENIIRFNAKFENNVLEHRICVVFDSEITSKFSIADQIYGIIERPVELETLKVWEKEKWEEIPNCIEPMQSFVTLANSDFGMALITDGVKEYEIIGEKYSKIRLTLFRTFNYMGKENLLYRPGRASGETIEETKDTQLLGDITTEFAVHTYQSKFDDAQVAKVSKKYLSPIKVYQFSDFLNGRMIFCYRDEERTLPLEYSWKTFNTEAIMGCLKKEEDGEKFIIRYFNPYLEKRVTVSDSFKEAVLLDEQTQDDLEYELDYCKIKTFKF